MVFSKMALHGGGHLELKKIHKGDFWSLFGIRLGRCPCIIPEKISFLQFYSRFNPNALTELESGNYICKLLEKLLPWFSTYDHLNYAGWAPIYYADMLSLEQSAPDIYQEFVGGNFVVKKTNGAFNQVPIDQATEWVNTLCKFSNGITGITKTDEIVPASHGERGLLFLKQQSICSASKKKTNLSQLARIVFCPEHETDASCCRI